VPLLPIEKKILDRLDAGLPDGRRRYSADHKSDRAAWRLVQEFAPWLDDRQAQKVIDELLKQKDIRSEDCEDPVEPKPVTVTQGLAVHPGKPCSTCSIHAFQSVGDRDQSGADATVAVSPRPPAQLPRTNVITDRQSSPCGSPLPKPQYLLLAHRLRCNSLGESASTQVGIT
jgi:hypothetical protein